MNWEVGSSMSVETQSSSIFTHLKSCCLELLDLLQNPKKQSPALSQLLAILRSSPSDAIQPLFEYVIRHLLWLVYMFCVVVDRNNCNSYTLFPLLLLLDAAVDSRSVQKRDAKEISAMPFANQTPNKVSDVVAEGMSVVLKKLTHGAMLSPSEAAEEFRGGVVRCFRTVLSNLIPCFDTSCSCKHSMSQPLLLDMEDSKCLITNHLEWSYNSKECLITFLQSEIASAAVGHWLSLMLNIAEAESSRGLRGSAKIRIEALLTLRMLVAKIGTPDALAFFLPGVVTQLARVLHVSKSMISGAAGSTEATEHAIKGLAEFLMVVLQDDANVPDLNSRGIESSQSFLEELRHLHVKTQDLSQTPVNKLSVDVVAMEEHGKKQSPNVRGERGPLQVKRSRDWLEKTTANVDNLLSKTFPHICVHSSKKVRRALLSAVHGLLSNCNYVLKGSRLMLMECLCFLVCDDSKDISMPAQTFLGFLFSSHGKYTIEDDLAELFNRILEKLPKLVLGCEESLALASAQQLLAVIYYSGPQLVADHLLRSPSGICLAGSLGKLVLSTPSSTGYLHSLAELRASSKNIYSACQHFKNIIEKVGNLGNTRTHSGQLLRQAGTAACILNEILFGMSDQALDVFRNLFHESGTTIEEKQKSYVAAFGQSSQALYHVSDGSHWKMNGAACMRQHVIDCVGTILHEYMAPEVWYLPAIHEPSLFQSSGKSESFAKHFLHDVLIEGIGIFNLTLVRHASDVVLRLVSATSGCLSVGHLVILNADYVIDSLCHQLRHLDLHPHVPNVISAMLSYIGSGS
ncbi:TELO2-interacting protein 1-like protein [Bienertia sinuspersici]